MDFRLPNINGQTSQEQIGQMKSYIYQLVQQLNFAFSSLENSNYEIVDTIVKANGNEGKSTDRQSKFNQLKDLIIKTAAIVNAYEEVWIKEFKGSYTADSDFGKYSRQTLNQITANSTNITAAFTKLSKITNPDGTGILDNIEAYIKAGELDTDIYGVEIGETNNGSFTHFARFTANRLSFYDGNGSEVAYVSNNKIFINKAQFNDVVSIGNDSGGELNVYNGKINVYVGTGNNQRKVLYADNDGNLVLSGIINANSGKIGNLHLSKNKLFGLANATNAWVSGLNGGYESASNNTIFLWAGARGGENIPAETTAETFGSYQWRNAKTIIENTANFYVTQQGDLYSKSGRIGGWNITDGVLKTTSGGKTTFFQPPNQGTWGIAVGATNPNDGGTAPFRVDHNGNMCATSGEIAGWKIASDRIYNKSSATGYTFSLWNPSVAGGTIISCNNGNDYPFYVNRDGSLHATKATITGTIQAGSIISSNAVGSANPTKLGGLYLLGNPANNGGTICSRNQDPGVITGYSHSGLSLTDYLLSIDAVGSNNKYAEIFMNGYSGTGQLSGTWSYTNGSSGSLSDKSHKNSIELLDDIDKFDTLFNKLKPIRYKYNAGTSNRYHIGYIAQEVESAISQSQLTEKDAALVIDIPDHDKDGNLLESSTKYLRYEEFIALNTWQIQKSKARIAELENTVAELTTRMTELEDRLSEIESTLN